MNKSLSIVFFVDSSLSFESLISNPFALIDEELPFHDCNLNSVRPRLSLRRQHSLYGQVFGLFATRMGLVLVHPS